MIRVLLRAVPALLLLFLPVLAEAWPVTVTDSLGRPVTVARQPQRLVVLGNSAADALRVLRAAERVVGVTDRIRAESAYWGALSTLPGVGRWNNPNLEAIAGLRPDLVVTYASNPSPGLEERLAPLGITVLRLSLNRLHTLEAELGGLGRALGQEKQAQEFLVWHRRALERIQALVATASTRPRVYLESPADYKIWGARSNWHEMADAAGCENVAAAVPLSRADVSPEWAVTAAPQLIVKTAAAHGAYTCPDPGLLPDVRAKVLARPGWEHIAAVRRGRVLALAGEFLSNLGAAVGVAHLAAFAHPELADAVNAPALQREYLTSFLGLADQGCYACSGERP